MATSNQIPWDPAASRIDIARLRDVAPEVVINLAGEPIAHRWTTRRKAAIRESRIVGTTALARALASLPVPPKVLVSGSGIHYYGFDRGDELLREDSSPGDGFLATVSGEWERATAPAAEAGIRVVLSRTGIVLGKEGGALERMVLPYRFFVGGPLGSGGHWMSWIAVDDAVRAIRFLAETPAVSGAVNLVGPDPVRNKDFATTLGRVLHQPSWFPVPAFVLRALFSTMADEQALSSLRVAPHRLGGAGFEFRHPRLEEALRFELRR